jgi:hypothetical protein
MTRKFGRMLMVIAGLTLLALPTRALAHDDDFRGRDGNRGGYQGRDRQHRDADLDDYAKLCDRDRDNCRPNPYFEGRGARDHDHDRDWSRDHDRPNTYSPGYSYGNPPRYQYNGNAALWQHRQALLDRDRRMRALYNAAAARGDRKAEKYYAGELKNTDKQYIITTRQLNAQGARPYTANPGFSTGIAPWAQHMFGY